MKQEEVLAARYGKKTSNKQRDRIAIVGFAAVALTIFFIWAISVTATNSSKPTGNLLSYSVESDRQITVEVSAENSSGKPVICQVEALATDYEVVSYQEVEIASGSAKTTLNSVKPAVSAVVKDCWFK